jgi:quercetin dioxygenase-like cupin family protein
MWHARRFALGIVLGALLGIVSDARSEPAGEYKSGVSARVVLRTTKTSNGEKIAYLRTDVAEVTAMTVEIAPGAETGWHIHPVPVYAWVVIGSLTIDLEGGKSNTYKEGDAIVEAVGAKHNGRNTGPVPVRLLVFYTGAEGEPNVRRVP